MKKIAFLITLVTASAAHANGASGNGTAGSGAPGTGNAGAGVAVLGYVDNWQTMNPVQRESIVAAQPTQKSVPSAKAEWPSWVKLSPQSNQLAGK
jgi:hypothetical protein